MPERPPALRLSVQLDPLAGDCPVDRGQLRRWVLGALERDAQITLRLVGTAEARALNSRFRGKDHATNVLTFSYDDPAPSPARRRRAAPAPAQADIVVCLPVVLREAREQAKTPRQHLGHLVVHGVLHAQGMDHETEHDATRMEAQETSILRRFRIPDPYRSTAAAT